MNALEFERFLEDYERDVYTFCRHLAGDGAGDLYQETALAAFEMVERIDPIRNPKSFLFSIAVGKWNNMRRKTARRQTIAPEIPPEEAPHGTTHKNTPEDAALTALQNETIHRAINGIKEKFRVPLILHYFDESTVEVIGEILKIPTGTVKSRLHKGRALLKTALEKEGITYG